MSQRSRLAAHEYRQIIKALCNSTELFSMFREQLGVHHFGSCETYSVVYSVLSDFYSEHKTLPTKEIAFIEIESVLSKFPDEHFSVEELEDLESFLDIEYAPDTLELSSKHWAISKIKNLLEEHLLGDIVAHSSSNLVTTQLPDLLENWVKESGSIESIGAHSAGESLTFDTGWDTAEPLMLRSTGLSFIDDFMCGGQTGGEVYGLMAPFGTCKTTIASMLCVNDAVHAQSVALEEPSRVGLSVFATFEAPKNPEILHRILMYKAKVQRGSLAAMGLEGVSALNDDESSPLDYEKRKFKQHIADGMFKPEASRVAEVIPVMNTHTFILDLTGSDPLFPYAGTGGLREIKQRLEAELDVRKRENPGNEYYISSIVVDYVGAMVRKQMAEENVDVSQIRHKITAAGIQGKEMSQHFRCPVWLVHQLSGQANSALKIGATLHHTDAAESKSFGENLDFCYVVGNLNERNQGKFACTKHRRAPKKPPKVIEVDGEFNHVFSRDDLYIDPNRSVIVDEDTAGTVGMLPTDNLSNPDIESELDEYQAYTEPGGDSEPGFE